MAEDANVTPTAQVPESSPIIVSTVDTEAADRAKLLAASDAAKTQDEQKAQEPPAPKQLTPEELQRKFDRDNAGLRRKYERQLQEEREARIRLEERLKQHQPAQELPKDEAPEIDFADLDGSIARRAAYEAAKHLEKTLAEREKQSAQEKHIAAQQKLVETWKKRVSESGIEDFDEVISSSDVPMNEVMKNTILESEHGPKLAMYLHTHREEAEKIATMTPIAAVRALTRIEDAINVKSTTATPAPIVPTGSRQTAVRSLTDPMSQSDFEKRRRAFIARR